MSIPLRLHAQPDAEPDPAPPTGPLRVLVVDDNRDTADSLAWIIRAWGHDARAVYDGPGAVGEATSWLPGVILLDLGMPTMDGYEVAREVRAEFEPAGWRPLVVAITGRHGDDYRKRAERDFNLYMEKPVDLDALRRLLEFQPHGPGNRGTRPEGA